MSGKLRALSLACLLSVSLGARGALGQEPRAREATPAGPTEASVQLFREGRVLLGQGRMAEAFNQALARVYDDCKDRPELKTARKITLTVSMKPRAEQGGSLDTVDVAFDVKDNVPKRESRTYNMTAGRGGLLWNELSPDEVRQKTLDMAPAPKGKVADAR